MVLLIHRVEILKTTVKLSWTGPHDRNLVTTKHEKRSHANHLFAVSYGSFQGSRLRSSILPFAIGTVASKGMDRSGTSFEQSGS